MLGLEIPFLLPNDDPCLVMGLKCPLEADTVHHLAFSLPVKAIFPAVEVKIKIELNDKVTGQNLVCLTRLVKLV